ncbi:SAM-dependent methyltransferase [Mechercharimyces sp. CAU 1602]|uniref:SAM-dependent methyltransferase n=1 Tax=Mechercharimyces sp. CAU 1602 TaxID=2973933 RepID=UPI002163D960|nr:SAM-dependent methyltransferase [Mechercharimyces sp. CAU 1602]MCS1352618.1 SAM-dependent methyltransferase [Mechercharimyces sp. CAU 1602]
MGEIVLNPIGRVSSPRKDMEDDFWGGIESTIQLDEQQFDELSIKGIEDFSHIEVVFYMHRVPKEKVNLGARHPRNQKKWPQVGVFSQRAKARPNFIGVSRCQLIKVEKLTLTVKSLDAIDGTPVLDIKPYMREFGPIGDVVQPDWSKEVMKWYFIEKEV